MFEKYAIKIVRLKSGEDIIGLVYDDLINRRVHIKYPKAINYVYNEDELFEEKIVLSDWISKNVFAYRDVYFSFEDVLFSSFSTVYVGMMFFDDVLETENVNEKLKKSIEQTLQEYKEELSEELDNITYH